eukprot:tig00000526_g1913.t1
MGFRASKNTDESGPAPAPGPGAEGRTGAPARVAPDPETVVEPAACSWRLRDRRRRAPRRAPERGAFTFALVSCFFFSFAAGANATPARRGPRSAAPAPSARLGRPRGGGGGGAALAAAGRVEPLLRAVAGLQLRAGGVAAAADVSAERLAAKLASSERVLRAVRAELTRFSAAAGRWPAPRTPRTTSSASSTRGERKRPGVGAAGEAHKAELRVASSSKPANGKPLRQATTATTGTPRFRSKEDAHLLVERCAEESLRAVAPIHGTGRDGALDGGEPEALPGS